MNLQSKAMEDSPLQELSEMEVSKLYDRIQNNGYKDAQGITGENKELSETYNIIEKEIETINKNYEVMNNKISEIKNTPKGITSRLDKQRTDLVRWNTRWKKNIQVEQLHEKRLKKYAES